MHGKLIFLKNGVELWLTKLVFFWLVVTHVQTRFLHLTLSFSHQLLQIWDNWSYSALLNYLFCFTFSKHKLKIGSSHVFSRFTEYACSTQRSNSFGWLPIIEVSSSDHAQCFSCQYLKNALSQLATKETLHTCKRKKNSAQQLTRKQQTRHRYGTKHRLRGRTQNR
jgi:hypothetical protein